MSFSLIELVIPCAEIQQGLVAIAPNAVHILLEMCLGTYGGPAPFTVGDDGGERFEMTGPWLDVDHAVTINGTFVCYSGRQGEKYRPRPVDATLRAIVPPDLPVGGPYDIAVFWSDFAGDPHSIVFPGVVTVVRRHRRSRAVDVVRLFTPRVFSRGLAKLEGGPILEAGASFPAAVPPLRSLLAAMGQVLNEAGGLIVTRLRSPLPPAQLGTVIDPASATAEVETSLGFDPGTVVINGEAIPFTGSTGDTLTGLTRDDSVSESYPRGAAVVQWSRNTSEAERARAMLLVDTSEGGFLDSLGRNYGVPRYLDALDPLYRRMIRTLAYQAGRGTRRAIGQFVDLILDGKAPSGPDADTGAPNIVTVASGPFTATMVGMNIEVAGVTYRINGYTDPTTVSLSLQPSLFWSTPNFGAASSVAWRLLPWLMEEDPFDPATARVVMFCAQPSSPAGFAYLQGGEPISAIDVNSVTVAYDIRQVIGVYAATDTLREGTNYATTNNFAAKTITLDTPLPGHIDVVVDYGSVAKPTAPVSGIPGSSTAAASGQILKDATIRNPGNAAEAADYPNRSAPLVRYPLYIGDRTGTIAALLEELTVAGVRSRLEVRLW